MVTDNRLFNACYYIWPYSPDGFVDEIAICLQSAQPKQKTASLSKIRKGRLKGRCHPNATANTKRRKKMPDAA